MNTMQLACFLSVAETLSFARAAEQLHVTQPAVTQQIHSLESELNVKLFRRTTRTVELTQAGLVFLSDAKAMLEISERAKKQAEYSVTDIREPFVIGCHAHNDILYLTQVLQQMRILFPNLYPIFQIIPFQHIYQRLLEEAVDVVVAFREDVKKSIQYQELIKIQPVGIMTSNHSLSRREQLSPDDFQQDTIISLNPQKCPADYKKMIHPILLDRSPAEVYFCDSAEAATVLAQAGYGVAIVPDILERNPVLKYLPIEGAEAMSYGIYYKTLTGRPACRAFVKLAKEIFLKSNISKPIS